MSVFCPKCSKQTYDEFKCDFCQYEIKEKRSNKRTGSINRTKKKNNLQLIMTTAVVIIALVGVYFAYQKYKENQQQEKAMKMIFGTTDIDKIEEMNKKNIKYLNKAMEKSGEIQMKMLDKLLETQNHK